MSGTVLVLINGKMVSGTVWEAPSKKVSGTKRGVRHRFGGREVSGTALGKRGKGVRHRLGSAKNGVLRNRWTEGPR